MPCVYICTVYMCVREVEKYMDAKTIISRLIFKYRDIIHCMYTCIYIYMYLNIYNIYIYTYYNHTHTWWFTPGILGCTPSYGPSCNCTNPTLLQGEA